MQITPSQHHGLQVTFNFIYIIPAVVGRYVGLPEDLQTVSSQGKNAFLHLPTQHTGLPHIPHLL